MPFKPTKSTKVALESPEAMFRDLRKRTVAAPHAHQADTLRSYQKEAMDSAHVALQLPTGSGKTLVGLLIGEWRRRLNGERVVYLCPTNQLVHQVVEQATTKYGIDARAFVGKKSEYDAAAKGEYTNSEAVAVTSYSSLFNTSPYFKDPQLVILDDAHAGENYISAFWSLRVERFRDEHAPLFAALIGVLAASLSPVTLQRLTGQWNDRWDKTWVDKIPTPVFHELVPELSAVIEAHVGASELRFAWSTVREHLSACHLFIGSSEILIRPLIPPSLTHGPFANAEQRLFMSATLGAGGDLERVTGVPRIHRLPAPEGWDRQGVGRRLFLFPGRSLGPEAEEDLQAAMIERAGRALVLVPDERTAVNYRDWITKRLKIPAFDARQIEQSKQAFVGTANAVAVIANRYDGIDLPKDECRLLVVEGLPKATNLQEQFLVAKMGAIALLNDRILTRMVQAFGRCTRDATDFAAVVVWGDELLSYLGSRDRRLFLHPEIQAEIDFGLEQSSGVESVAFMEYLDAFLRQSPEWAEAESSIVSLRGAAEAGELPGTHDLMAAVGHEVEYEYCLWKGRYPEALEEARGVLAALNAPELRGYRALWLYLAGSAAWLATSEGVASLAGTARDYYRQASAAALGVKWLATLTNDSGQINADGNDQSLLMAVIERLESRLEQLGMSTDLRFAKEEAFIRENIGKADKGSFEAAHERLGRLLGYESGNKETTGAPDPWWIADESACFIFEDHSNAISPCLDVTKARQAASHPKWARANLKLSLNALVLPVLISPVTKADSDALPHLDNVLLWRIEDFRRWADQAITVVRELRRTFPGAADIAWRSTAVERYRQSLLDPSGLAGYLMKSPARIALQ